MQRLSSSLAQRIHVDRNVAQFFRPDGVEVNESDDNWR
jgi:hypothetical protein